MSVTAYKNIPAADTRSIFRIEKVTVCTQSGAVSEKNKKGIGSDGKLKYHSVYLRIAVPPYAENVVFYQVEHFCRAGGVVSVRKRIAGTVIKDIPQKNKALHQWAEPWISEAIISFINFFIPFYGVFYPLNGCSRAADKPVFCREGHSAAVRGINR